MFSLNKKIHFVNKKVHGARYLENVSRGALSFVVFMYKKSKLQ